MIETILLAGVLAIVAPQGGPADATTPPDSWERVRELAPGKARAEALLRVLGEVSAEELPTALQLAYEEFRNQTRAYRLDLALPLAEAMHRHAAAPWSAMSLALASTRQGDAERAGAVLLAQLRTTPDGAEQYELLERLGLAALGAGNAQEARKFLGAAFARGSANAGVVLGRMALSEGRLEESRAIFRSLLNEEPSRSWAHRGWGLSMLPTAPRRR